jgi:hypothetical protein
MFRERQLRWIDESTISSRSKSFRQPALASLAPDAAFVDMHFGKTPGSKGDLDAVPKRTARTSRMRNA